MKFYSEITKELYNSEKELVNAEAKMKEAEARKIEAERVKKEARAKRAKEVEEAIKKANEAQTIAVKLLREFTKDYGYFHMSYSGNDVEKVEQRQERANKETENIEVSDFFDLLTSFLG